MATDRLLKTSRGWTRSALIGILLVGAFLRLHQLEYKSLWVDEILQVQAARAGIEGVLRLGAHAAAGAPPLDLLITALVIPLGTNEFILRFPAAAWGCVTIALTFAVAMQSTRDRRIGLAAAFLVALAPLLVRFSQEVRFYSLPIMLGLLAAYTFEKSWRAPSMRRWALFAIVLSCGALAFYFLLLVAVGLIGGKIFESFVLTRVRRIERSRWLGFSAALIAAVAALFFWMASLGLTGPGDFSFTFPLWTELIGETVTSGHIGGVAHLLAVRVLGMIALPLFALLGVVRSLRARQAWGITFGLIVVIGVIGVLAADAMFSYFFTVRQLLFVVPFYLILVAAGIVFLSELLFQKRAVPVASSIAVLVAVIAIIFGLSLRAYYDWPKEDWRSAARLLENARAQNIFTEPGSLRGYLFYYQPALADVIQDNTRLAELARGDEMERAWIVTLANEQPSALDVLQKNGWRAIRLDVSPTLNIFYAGRVAENDLWREAAAFDLPPQVLLYSELLARVRAFDPALAQSVARRAHATMLGLRPPLLDAQQTRLMRRLGRVK